MSAVRYVYPCVHSGDFYGTGSAGVVACCYRGRSDYNFGLHADSNVGGEYESSCNETPEISHWNNKSNI